MARRSALNVLFLVGLLVGCSTTPPVSSGVDSYPYGDAVSLGDELVELVLDGVRVSVPAVREGASASVEVALVDEPIEVVTPLAAFTQVVALRFAGDLDFVGSNDDEAPVLRLALQPSVAGAAFVSPSGLDDSSAVALVWVRVDGGSWVPLVGMSRWDGVAEEFLVSVAHVFEACTVAADPEAAPVSCEFAWQVVDAGALIAAEDVIDAAGVAGGVARASTVPTATGMYKVNLEAFAAAGESCEIDRLQAFLTHENERSSWIRSARTAVVFVHGWQSVAGQMKGLNGDEPSALPAHCSNWEAFLSGFASAGGPWASLRANAEVFTFRYNSNRRVADAGVILAGWLPQMQALGYERVVLVGHSMGGLVVHDARERVFRDGRSGLGAIDLPVITLATPYMGGPLLCTEVEAGFCQAADSSLLTSIWGLVPVSGMPSTLDLSTALNVSALQRILMGHQDQLGLALPYERNPYLLGLLASVNLLDPSLTAFVGNSAARPFFPSVMYLPAVHMLRPGWGRSDGIVPLASGRAAMDLAYTDPSARLANVFEFGRDHGFMTSGCGDHFSGLCPAGDWTDDVYLDAVAERMLAYTLIGDGDISVLVAPESVTVGPGGSQQFTATVSGTGSTGVTWSSTCGSIGGSGNTVSYTAPASAGRCEVTATSVAEPSASGTAVVTVRSGSTLALVSLDGNLAILEAEGSLTSLRDTPATLTHGKWDAGQTRLLVTERISDAGSDHRVLEFDDDGVVVGDDRVLLVPPPAAGAWSRSFGWHPDGVSVLYREREMRHCDHTFVMRWYPDGTETVFLDPAWVGHVIVYSLDIHPNGREVLWTSQVGCWSPTLAVFRANLVDGAVDVDSIDVLLDDGQHVDFARFSPDGSLIAFMRSDASRGYNGPENLYVMNVDGSGIRALTNNTTSAQRVRTLAWSADSESLLFSMSTDTGSTYEVYEASVSEPGTVQLTNASGRAFVLDW